MMPLGVHWSVVSLSAVTWKMPFSFLAFLKAAEPIVVICFWIAVAVVGLDKDVKSGLFTKMYSRFEQSSKIEFDSVLKFTCLRSMLVSWVFLKAAWPMVET